MKKHKNQVLYRFLSHLLVFLACECLVFSTFGFQILPRVSDLDRKLANLGGNRRLDPFGQFAMSEFLPKISLTKKKTVLWKTPFGRTVIFCMG